MTAREARRKLGPRKTRKQDRTSRTKIAKIRAAKLAAAKKAGRG